MGQYGAGRGSVSAGMDAGRIPEYQDSELAKLTRQPVRSYTPRKAENLKIWRTGKHPKCRARNQHDERSRSET
jgi:hypothetical protein